jgi:hypothetical protein
VHKFGCRYFLALVAPFFEAFRSSPLEPNAIWSFNTTMLEAHPLEPARGKCTLKLQDHSARNISARARSSQLHFEASMSQEPLANSWFIQGNFANGWQIRVWGLGVHFANGWQIGRPQEGHFANGWQIQGPQGPICQPLANSMFIRRSICQRLANSICMGPLWCYECWWTSKTQTYTTQTLLVSYYKIQNIKHFFIFIFIPFFLFRNILTNHFKTKRFTNFYTCPTKWMVVALLCLIFTTTNIKTFRFKNPVVLYDFRWTV